MVRTRDPDIIGYYIGRSPSENTGYQLQDDLLNPHAGLWIDRAAAIAQHHILLPRNGGQLEEFALRPEQHSTGEPTRPDSAHGPLAGRLGRAAVSGTAAGRVRL